MNNYRELFIKSEEEKANDFTLKENITKDVSDEEIRSMKVFCHMNYPLCINCMKSTRCKELFNHHPPFAGTKDY